jgi:hypothetical protein
VDENKIAAPSIFDAFNARALNPFQVAETFVPPSHYSSLVQPVHSVIVGPRGSGKTTLLKMLQSPALEAWRHRDAAFYRAHINYTGVFVPTDIGWSEQIKALGEPILGVAAFTTQVLRALVDAVEYRTHAPDDQTLIPHRRVVLNREQEVMLVKEVSRLWQLKVALPSLLSLKYALTARLAQIKELSNREKDLGSDGRKARLSKHKYLYFHFIDSALILVEIFNDLVKESDAKWGLLFDELELAPRGIREDLVRSLRSRDSRLLFKLSISPYGEDLDVLQDDPTAPKPGEDYDEIPLWYAQKEDGYEFCNALFKAMLSQNNLGTADPSIIFGKAEFEPSGSTGQFRSAYHPGSRFQKRFLRMAEKDSSFRDYLKMKEVDPRALHLLNEDERAALVRKITPIVTAREAFRSSDLLADGSLSYHVRSRKNPALYRGAKSLFAIVEGNPRWFIAIIGNLLEHYTPNARPISPAKQGSEVLKAANRFRAFLKTIPCPAIKIGQRPRGVLSIIDVMGNYIFDDVVRSKFNADPVGSFTVDSHVSKELIDSLGRALNAGAIVYVPDEESHSLLGSLRGKRFRLSYLLAPHFGIPIRLGRSISLTAVLKTEKQPSLFYQSDDYDE